jgi:NAD(P)-dependent dehydrogenase (short-subunit alcohol dehydrogenase family)
MTLESLPDGYRAVVFGSSGGLGSAFVDALRKDRRCAHVYAASRRDTHAATGKLSTLYVDLEDESTIASAADGCAQDGPLHLILVATGLLHGQAVQPEKTWTSLDSESLRRAFAINAIGPALIAKHSLRHLESHGKSVFAALSARVSSIGDNRLGGWYAYRSSKAAPLFRSQTRAVLSSEAVTSQCECASTAIWWIVAVCMPASMRRIGCPGGSPPSATTAHNRPAAHMIWRRCI